MGVQHSEPRVSASGFRSMSLGFICLGRGSFFERRQSEGRVTQGLQLWATEGFG